MSKKTNPNPAPEVEAVAQNAPEVEEANGKENITKGVPKIPTYALLDPDTAQVTFEGETYKAKNGRLVCPPDVARKLMGAGFLKSL
jgi:hypothetical protein